MFSVVLATVAYTLLISSFVTFVILLKKQFTQWVNTAFYILSMSDVLCSVLTAGVLLLNHIQDLNNISYVGENNTFSLKNITWEEEEVNEEHYRNTIKKFNTSDNMTAENKSSIIMSYCITHIMMQYSMLLLPLTNSFVSLLIFTTQCNLNLMYLKNQCTRFFQFQENQMNKNVENIENLKSYDGKKSDIEIIDCELEDPTMKLDSNLDLGKYKTSSITRKIRNIETNIFERFKFNEMKNENKKILSMFVLSQWIIPFLAIGTMYFGEYNTEYIKSSENSECSIDNNFFFNNCCYNENITSNLNWGMYIPLHENLIHYENVWKLPNPNDTQVHTIVSKIQSIIFSAMNDTSKIQNVTPATFYDNFELLDEAKYVQSNTNVSKFNKNNDKSEYNFTDEIVTVHDIIYDTFPYKKSETSKAGENVTYILYDELPTEQQEMEAIKNAEVTSESSEPYYENVINTDVLTKLQSAMQNIVEATTSHNAADVSNDQIYAEILKRIHGTNWYYNVKQPKQHKFNQQTFQKNSDLMKTILPIVNGNINKIFNTSDIDKTQVHMTHKCYISNRFLKLYFLLLAFLLYFLPILLSSILQVHGKLTCRIILYKFRTRNQVLCTNCAIDHIEGTNEITSIDIEKESNSSGSSLFTKKGFHQTPNKSSEVLQEIQINEELGNTKQSSNSISDTVLNKEEKYMSIIKQIEDIQKLFDTNKVSLLCGTLLWTPLFLKVLFKIFLCLQISKWLLSATYLVALTFNLLRNIFNLKMIRLQNSITSAPKGNSIIPIN